MVNGKGVETAIQLASEEKCLFRIVFHSPRFLHPYSSGKNIDFNIMVLCLKALAARKGITKCLTKRKPKPVHQLVKLPSTSRAYTMGLQ